MATVLSQQFSGITRYTLISENGLVLYDSQADAGQMDNHASRPEVSKAARTGEAVSMRYSETLGTDTVYAAEKLSDGRIVRLSETRHSLFAFLGEMLVPTLFALVVVAGLVFLLSRLLTRHIMKPIDALDMAEPLENDIYGEMVPLLQRIDDQQTQLKKQNKELAEAESMRRDFSSNVSHEMKTPLQVISGYAELMKNDMVLPEDRQKFAGLIYDEAQAMRGLINDVLTLSKLDESAFAREERPIDVTSVARRMAGRLESFAADEGVSISVKGGSTRDACRGDAVQPYRERGALQPCRRKRVGARVAGRCVRGGFGGAARGRGGAGPRIGGHGARERYRGGHSRGDARKGVRAVLPSG